MFHCIRWGYDSNNSVSCRLACLENSLTHASLYEVYLWFQLISLTSRIAMSLINWSLLHAVPLLHRFGVVSLFVKWLVREREIERKPMGVWILVWAHCGAEMLKKISQYSDVDHLHQYVITPAYIHWAFICTNFDLFYRGFVFHCIFMLISVRF
jgi:hypothetical protein